MIQYCDMTGFKIYSIIAVFFRLTKVESSTLITDLIRQWALSSISWTEKSADFVIQRSIMRYRSFPLTLAATRVICHFEKIFSRSCLLKIFRMPSLLTTFLISFPAAFTKMITINGQEYNLQLVDTAGQVWFSILAGSLIFFFRSICALIIMF